MKKMLSVLTALIIASLAVVSVGALSHPDYPGLEFANDYDDNLYVSSYSGSDSALIIPETVYNKSVLRIGENALKNNSVVKSVIMHDNMTNIKSRALYQCADLSYVYYSQSLQVAGDYAFAYNRTNITSAFLRNTIIRELGSGVYHECNNLEYLTLPDTLETINGSVFYNTAVRKVVLPSNVKTLGARSFASCSALEKIYVPASVTTIGTDVFYNSSSVTVYTPEGSAMQTYCEDNNITYENLSEEDFPSRLLGDTNGDGELNINDATYIQRELAGYRFDFYADNCDFNGDCKLNINDSTEIQLGLVGLK